ncbi:glycosyl transferase [Roseovarius sp. HI0049]|nr:glycosyl transferase [Roseovarius sp. HI0049]
MGISELRHLAPAKGGAGTAPSALERDLLARGTVSRDDLERAGWVQARSDATLDRILTAEGLASEADLLEANARAFKSRSLTAEELAQLTQFRVDTPVELLLRHAVLPVVDRDGKAAIVCADRRCSEAIRPHLPVALNPVRVLLAPRPLIQQRIAELHRPALSRAMVTRVPEEESCRTWGQRRGVRLASVAALLLGLALMTVLYPRLVFGILAGWAVVTLIVSALFKMAAFVTGLVVGPPPPPPQPLRKLPLPRVSVLVPLFRETEIVHELVARLTRLTYPKSLLDVILVLEEEDGATREALAGIDLPPWIRAVVVPDGTPRTKPRAMNYALDFCDGDIIGIYDAEDAPAPDQIMQVVRKFTAAPPEMACVQGYLDYYNPRQNWLARCFTIEYATWFRLMLPGLARLGLAIPLGGTTVFCRRDALERVGAWDSHNVTEDADLGFRLARHGYRTEMLATVTGEEANCLPWPWIKQRSRWLKGYMTTYLVHMRRPHELLRQLGAWRFMGFQAHFVTALSQVTLAPLLWSFWLVLLGLPHPLDPVLPHWVMVGLGSLFLTIEVINLTIHATAVARARHRHLILWTPTMHFYGPLGAVAAYKALYELVLKPFFWDKTRHGLSQGGGHGRPALSRGSDGAFDFP